MSNRTIEQLPTVKHEDVEPMYTREEILDKLAAAVSYSRSVDFRGDQRLVFELMYSMMKALK